MSASKPVKLISDGTESATAVFLWKGEGVRVRVFESERKRECVCGGVVLCVCARVKEVARKKEQEGREGKSSTNLVRTKLLVMLLECVIETRKGNCRTQL